MIAKCVDVKTPRHARAGLHVVQNCFHQTYWWS